MTPARPKILQKVRIQSLRMDVAALHHARIFRILAGVVASIYLFRALLSAAFLDLRSASLLFLSALFNVGLFLVGKQSDRVKSLSLLLIVMMLIIEAVLVVIGSLHFIQFFLAVPIAIVFSALMIGMFSATLVASASTAVALYMIKRAEAGTAVASVVAQGEIFRYGFLLYLIGSIFLIVLIIYLFQDILAKSEQDIHLRRVEEARSTRRLALAETIGKAAHELNNPLAILDGAFRRLKYYQTHPDEQQQFKNLEYMRDSVKRLRDVLESIRVFVEGDLEEQFESVSLDEMLSTFQLRAREKLLSFGVTLRIENHLRGERLYCRPRQVHYVLQVFLDNAIEAMKGSDKFLKLVIREKHAFVRIELEDNGVGIPELDTEKIFTPFFSTKSLGKSIGMNLSISRVLVQEQGGHIGFERMPEGGTRFFIELSKTEMGSVRLSDG